MHLQKYSDLFIVLRSFYKAVVKHYCVPFLLPMCSYVCLYAPNWQVAIAMPWHHSITAGMRARTGA